MHATDHQENLHGTLETFVGIDAKICGRIHTHSSNYPHSLTGQSLRRK